MRDSPPTLAFVRPLYPADDPHGRGPTTGDDVLAVKRAISRMGYWPWGEFDREYNDRFAHGVGRRRATSGVAGYQASHDLPATGWYGRRTHELLVASRVPAGLPHAGEWAFDQASINLYRGSESYTEAEQIITRYYQWWDMLVRNEPYWHYSQQRPIRPLTSRLIPRDGVGGYLDCSGSVIYVAWLAGAKSPDPHYAYTGYGNTDSLRVGGEPVPMDQVAEAARSRLVLGYYGRAWWATEHVVAAKSPTEVYSMGREQDPAVRPSLTYRPDFLGCRAYEVI